MIKDSYNIAILLIIYDRDFYLAKLAKTLNEIKPQKIYIAADGSDLLENQKKCEITRKKIEELITWDCTIKKKI